MKVRRYSQECILRCNYNPKKQNIIQVIKFALFSASAGIIQIVSFTLLFEVANLNNTVSYIISLALSVLWNFTLNRKFTFQSATNIPIAMLKVLAFYAVFTPLSTLLGNFLSEDLGWNEYLVTAINLLLNFTTEYLYQRFFVFGKSIDSNKKS